MRIVISSKMKGGLDDEVANHFGPCPFFTVVIVDNKEIKGVEIIENPHYAFKQHKPIVIPDLVASLKPDLVICNDIGPMAIKELEKRNIKFIKGCSGKIEEVVNDFLKGKIKESFVAKQVEIEEGSFLKEMTLKIAVSTTIGGLNDQVSNVFGRCKTFTVIDIQNAKIIKEEIKENNSFNASTGAGSAAAQFVIDLNVNAVISGNYGPNALSVFSQSDVKQYVCSKLTVEKAINQFMSGNLSLIES